MTKVWRAARAAYLQRSVTSRSFSSHTLTMLACNAFLLIGTGDDIAPRRNYQKLISLFCFNRGASRPQNGTSRFHSSCCWLAE
jgi:hypothetical protein